MLDTRSLDVISKFKLALLTQAQTSKAAPSLATSNRGKKLPHGSENRHLLSKVVEYEGTNHLVLTNDVIERSNYRNKRRWQDYYQVDTGNSDESESSGSQSDDSDSNEEDENPFKKLHLSEILAPLSHPAELVTHPAISKTYRLPCLTNLASDLIDLIEVEQNTLNHLNKLLQVLDGEDWFYLLEENMGLPVYDHGLDDSVTDKKKLEDEKKEKAKDAEPERGVALKEEDAVVVTDPFFALPETLAKYEAFQQKHLEEAEAEESEAEGVQQDLVNYLQVSIQRQHEYIKNLTSIRNGIVKADRYKSDLYKWGKEMHEKKS